MHINANGIVIKSYNVRENDKYITLLTDTLGKIRLSVNGAYKKGSPLAASAQLFAFSEMTLFENRGRYQMDSASLRTSFFALSEDIEKLSLGSYFCEILDNTTFEGSDCSDILTLTVYALHALCAENADISMIKAVFELRLMALLGYSPSLSKCAVCGMPESMPAFDVSAGGVVCKKCAAKARKNSVTLTRGAFDAVNFIINAPINKIFRISLGETSASVLCEIAEKYLLSRIERGLSTLEFYKRLAAARFMPVGAGVNTGGN